MVPFPLVGAFFLAGLADTDVSIPLGWALFSAPCAHGEEEMLKVTCHKKQFGIRQNPLEKLWFVPHTNWVAQVNPKDVSRMRKRGSLCQLPER